MIHKTIIIGGGLSGLSAAYYLKQKGEDFLLLEKESRTGGVMDSFNVDNRIFDKAAVSFSLTSEIEEMVSTLNLQDELVQASAESAARFIFRRGKLRKLTANPTSIFISPLLSWKAKFRLLKETRIKSKSPNGESVADFVSRRFGKELYESVANAVLSGIYAGNPEEMEAAVVLKQFVAYESDYGSVIKGMKANKGKNKRIISSFRNGSSVLTSALYNYVKEHVVSDSEVIQICRSGIEYEVKTQEGNSYAAEKVISCLPSFELSKIVETDFRSLSNLLNQIKYCKVNMSHLAYKSADIKKSIDGFGFLIPSIEKKPLLGAVLNSKVFENRAPEDETTFTVFSNPDRASVHKVQAELESILGITSAPVYSEITSWARAIPQFHIGYSELLEKLTEFEKNENIRISGNFRSGVSVGDCVKYQKEIIG